MYWDMITSIGPMFNICHHCCSVSHVWPFATPWTVAHQASLSFIICRSLLKFLSIESVRPSNHLILCHPLLLLHSVFPSIRVLSNELVLCIRCPKYWSYSICPSNEYWGLISFRIDSFDLAVEEILKSLSPYIVPKIFFLWWELFRPTLLATFKYAIQCYTTSPTLTF